jgi:hypothetical protein
MNSLRAGLGFVVLWFNCICTAIVKDSVIPSNIDYCSTETPQRTGSGSISSLEIALFVLAPVFFALGWLAMMLNSRASRWHSFNLGNRLAAQPNVKIAVPWLVDEQEFQQLFSRLKHNITRTQSALPDSVKRMLENRYITERQMVRFLNAINDSFQKRDVALVLAKFVFAQNCLHAIGECFPLQYEKNLVLVELARIYKRQNPVQRQIVLDSIVTGLVPDEQFNKITDDLIECSSENERRRLLLNTCRFCSYTLAQVEQLLHLFLNFETRQRVVDSMLEQDGIRLFFSLSIR